MPNAEKPVLRNPPEEHLTLKEIEELLCKAHMGLQFKPPCRNPAEPCLSKQWGFHKGKSRFWYGSDCKLPAQKFCDPCLACWHTAVARNIVLFAMRREAMIAAEEAAQK